MPKGNKKLIDAMNEALSEELASIIQYLWQMYEETLATEEGHANDWETVLGK